MNEKRNASGYRFFSTIRKRLALLLLAILIPILVVQIIIYRDRFETLRRVQLRANLEMARAVADTFQVLIEDLLNNALSIGLALTRVRSLTSEDIYWLLKGNQAAYPFLLNVFWVSPKGRIFASSDSRSAGSDVSDRDFFRQIASGRDRSVSNLRISEETSFPIFTVSRAIRNPKGTLTGILVFTALAGNLETVFPIDRLGGGTIVIIDGSGRTVIRSPEVHLTWENRSLIDRIPSVKKALAGTEVTETIVDPLDNKKHIFAIAPIRSIGWAVGASRPEDQALAPVFSHLGKDALLFSLVVFLSVLVFLLIANSISNPLKRLQRHALDLGKGKSKPLKDFKGPVELYNLAHALDFMTNQLNLQIEALAESERRYRMMGEILPFGVWLSDKEGRAEYVSPSFLELLDMNMEEQKGFGWTKRLVPEDVEPMMKKWLHCVQTGSAWDHEHRIIDRNGRIRTVLSRGLPVKDNHGRIKNWAGINLDITSRKEAEEALQQLNETLEQRVSERTELAEDRAKQLQALISELTLSEQRERRRLAEILHDHLQQLLVAAKINSEVLSERIDTDQKPTAETIVDLITQSIQVSRSLTAELSPPFLQQGGLAAALEWLARWMQENHGLMIELAADSGIDPEREDITVLLYQSIRELLFNVVKHAGVKSARIDMFQDQENRIRVSVIDPGCGFDPDTIWEKAKSGNGFGLFSIRERLMLLGGSLEVESAPGRGSTFSLIVPLELAKRKAEEHIEKKAAKYQTFQKSGGKIRVLLADDHTVVRQGLSTMLNLYSDIEIIGEASDGEEAVRMSRELKPDVILMDINMPNMDGLEATRVLHAEFPNIRIIGLSMYEENDQAASMIEAGASAYCTKGGETDVLLSAIRGKTGGVFFKKPDSFPRKGSEEGGC